MAAFPIFTSFETKGYGLYPGVNGDGIFQVSFAQGLTLVLGANGLGKSSLISMLFRMLTGPSDLAIGSGPLGTSELSAVVSNRTMFAARTRDGAKNASATLKFELGGRQFLITRSLNDLSLISFELDSEKLGGEEGFQSAVLKCASLATFGEWILVLRTVVFFFRESESADLGFECAATVA